MSQDSHIDESTARVGLKAALAILGKWQCSISQIEQLLDLKFADSELTLAANLNQEQLLRISYILNIHASLRNFFSNNNNIYGYMTMINNNAPFNGSKPLDTALEHGGLKIVMDHVMSIAQC